MQRIYPGKLILKLLLLNIGLVLFPPWGDLTLLYPENGGSYGIDQPGIDIEQGQYDRAIEQLTRMQNRRKSDDRVKTLLAKALLLRAFESAANREEGVGRAIKLLQSSLEVNRSAGLLKMASDRALFLGLAHRFNGDLESSYRYFQLAIRLDPANHHALYNLAAVLEEMGRLQDSDAAFQQYQRSIAD